MSSIRFFLPVLLGALAGCTTSKAALDEPIKVPLTPVIPAKQQLCTQSLPSGLGFKPLKAGEGASPAAGDIVLVRYIGYFRSNGEVFDQNAEAAFPVDGVIAGFSEGLKQMKKGAIHRLCIPGKLGYGENGTPDGSIPANADLGFQVELVDFKSPAEIEAMRAASEPTPEPVPEPAIEASKQPQ